MLAQRHHLRLHLAPDITQAVQALEQGHCAGLLYTEAAVHHLRRQPHWQDYRTPLAPTLVVPWTISVARSEQGRDLERRVGDVVARWHRDGTLIALEKKWALKPSQFLQTAKMRWSERRLDGRWVCVRDAHGQWPVACRDPAFVESHEAQGLLGLALHLRDEWGIRLAPRGEAFDVSRYRQSLVLTGVLTGSAIMGIALALVRGMRLARRSLGLDAARGDHRAEVGGVGLHPGRQALGRRARDLPALGSEFLAHLGAAHDLGHQG
jgi:polar amino acid transport system substrate-binding protein